MSTQGPLKLRQKGGKQNIKNNFSLLDKLTNIHPLDIESQIGYILLRPLRALYLASLPQVHKHMELLYSKECIAARVAQLGAAISRDYAHTEIVAIVILKGAFMFAADLLRSISVPVTLEFMQTASYYNETCSGGEVEIVLDLHSNIAGKHVIVIEDILDSGRTLKALQNLLSKRNPASMRLCTLLDKRERREVKIEADYVGMEIADKFAVGYGLDYEGRYRQFEQIYII